MVLARLLLPRRSRQGPLGNNKLPKVGSFPGISGATRRHLGSCQPSLPRSAGLYLISCQENRGRDFDFYAAAKEISGEADLLPVPFKHSVTKGSAQNIIDFELGYDTNPNFDNVGSTEEEVSFAFENDNEFIGIELSGSIKARLGVKNRWEVANGEFDSFDPFVTARAKYDDYVLTVLGLGQADLDAMPLNNNEMSSSVRLVKSRGEVNFTYKFDNFSQTPDNSIFRSFDYTIQVNNACKNYTAAPRVAGSGGYTVQNLGAADRGTVSVSGTALKKRGFPLAMPWPL